MLKKNDNINISLLVAGLQDTALKHEQKALLEVYQAKLLKLLPHVELGDKRVAEIVSLASATGREQYSRIVNSYLALLKRESVLESYHIQGLADILSVASQSDWGSASHGDQIVSILLERGEAVLLNPANKQAGERYQMLSLWQQVLFILTESGTIIKEEQKDKLAQCFRTFEESLKHQEGNDEVGLSLLGLARQSLLHVKDDKAPLWQRVGLRTLSATKNITLSVAALGAMPVTFGLSSLGAIAPGLEAAGDLSALIKDVYHHLKDKRDTKEWYQQLLNLRSLLILSVHYKKEKEFKDLIENFIALSDKKLKLVLAHGLIDTVIQILISWPTEQHQSYHQSSYQFMSDCLNNLDDRVLEARLFAATMGLQKGAVVNESFIDLWIEYVTHKVDLFYKWPLTSDVMSPFRVFYQQVEVMKQAYKAKKGVDFPALTKLQSTIANRLAVDYAINNNEFCLKTLYLLQFDEQIIDKAPLEKEIHPLLTDTNVKVRASQVEQQVAQQLNIEKSTPPLMLIVWKSLKDEKHVKELLEIFKQYDPTIEVEHEVTITKAPSYLFEQVDKMIVGLLISETGVQIHNYPKNEEERKSLQMILDFKEKQLAKERKAKPQLAKQIGFSFIGHYVEGFQEGVNVYLVQEAVRLAEQYLSKEEQALSQILENNTQAQSYINSTEIKVATDGIKKTEQEKVENIEYSVEEKGTEQDHVVKINYRGVSAESAKDLQVILEGALGVKAATYLGVTKRTRTEGKYIAEIRFEEQADAKSLQKALEFALKYEQAPKMDKSAGWPTPAKQ